MKKLIYILISIFLTSCIGVKPNSGGSSKKRGSEFHFGVKSKQHSKYLQKKYPNPKFNSIGGSLW